MMPGVDGFEFVERLRGRDGAAPIPVVVLTAKDVSAEERERLNGQVARILQKGTAQSEVLAEVHRLLDAGVPRSA
jgi:CheY-like chemotaxis protein